MPDYSMLINQSARVAQKVASSSSASDGSAVAGGVEGAATGAGVGAGVGAAVGGPAAPLAAAVGAVLGFIFGAIFGSEPSPPPWFSNGRLNDLTLLVIATYGQEDHGDVPDLVSIRTDALNPTTVQRHAIASWVRANMQRAATSTASARIVDPDGSVRSVERQMISGDVLQAAGDLAWIVWALLSFSEEDWDPREFLWVWNTGPRGDGPGEWAAHAADPDTYRAIVDAVGQEYDAARVRFGAQYPAAAATAPIRFGLHAKAPARAATARIAASVARVASVDRSTGRTAVIVGGAAVVTGSLLWLAWSRGLFAL